MADTGAYSRQLSRIGDGVAAISRKVRSPESELLGQLWGRARETAAHRVGDEAVDARRAFLSALDRVCHNYNGVINAYIQARFQEFAADLGPAGLGWAEWDPKRRGALLYGPLTPVPGLVRQPFPGQLERLDRNVYALGRCGLGPYAGLLQPTWDRARATAGRPGPDDARRALWSVLREVRRLGGTETWVTAIDVDLGCIGLGWEDWAL